MLRIICFCFLVLVSDAPYEQSGKTTLQSPQSSRRQKLLKLAQDRFKAFFEGDRATYERLIAKDAVLAYSNGRVLDYAQAMIELAPLAKAGTFTFHYEDVQFRDFGDSALLVYKLVFHGPPEIGNYSGIESDTWAKRNDGWQLIALHGTTIPYPDRRAMTLDPKLLDEYVGRYSMGLNDYYDITRNGSRLMGRRSGFPNVPWLAESDSSFYVPSDPSATRIFMRDSTGHVSALLRVEAAGNTVWTRTATDKGAQQGR